MSVTLVARSKDASDYMPNISGWHVFGELLVGVGMPVVVSITFSGELIDSFDCPLPPDSMSARQAKQAANLIEYFVIKNPKSHRAKWIHRRAKHGLADKSIKGLVEYAQMVVEYLRTSKGYRCI